MKWLQRVRVQADPSNNYFQESAYRILPADSEPAPGAGFSLSSLSLTSAILAPAPGTAVASGTVEVTGYAVAGDDRNIARVDVSGDDGRSWVQAELGEDYGPWTWRLWRADVNVAPDCRELLARAWDTAGMLQPERPESVWNPKGYNNTSWARQPLRVHD